MNEHAFAEKVTSKIYERTPSLLERYGERGKKKCLEDNLHHVRQLSTAVELNNGEFFVDYARWLNGILMRHGMETSHLIENFEIIFIALEELTIAGEKVGIYREFLEKAIKTLSAGD